MTKLLKHLAQLDAAVSASRLGPTGRHCVHLSDWERLSHSEERRGVRTMHKLLQAGPRWPQLRRHYSTTCNTALRTLVMRRRHWLKLNDSVLPRNRALVRRNWTILWNVIFSIQCSDSVGWATGRASGPVVVS